MKADTTTVTVTPVHPSVESALSQLLDEAMAESDLPGQPQQAPGAVRDQQHAHNSPHASLATLTRSSVGST